MAKHRRPPTVGRHRAPALAGPASLSDARGRAVPDPGDPAAVLVGAVPRCGTELALTRKRGPSPPGLRAHLLLSRSAHEPRVGHSMSPSWPGPSRRCRRPPCRADWVERKTVTATVRFPWATTAVKLARLPMTVAGWPATVAVSCEVPLPRSEATVAATRSVADAASSYVDAPTSTGAGPLPPRGQTVLAGDAAGAADGRLGHAHDVPGLAEQRPAQRLVQVGEREHRVAAGRQVRRGRRGRAARTRRRARGRGCAAVLAPACGVPPPPDEQPATPARPRASPSSTLRRSCRRR